MGTEGSWSDWFVRKIQENPLAAGGIFLFGYVACSGSSAQGKPQSGNGTTGTAENSYGWTTAVGAAILGYFVWNVFSDQTSEHSNSYNLMKRKKIDSQPDNSGTSIGIGTWIAILGGVVLLLIIVILCVYCRSSGPPMPFDIEAQYPHYLPPRLYDHPLARHRRMNR